MIKEAIARLVKKGGFDSRADERCNGRDYDRRSY